MAQALLSINKIHMTALIVSLVMFMTSCDDFPNSPELVDKFRTIGVGYDKPSYTYSTESIPSVAQLSFYFATPSKEAITFENKVIQSPALPLTFGTAELVEEKAALNIYRVTATAILPTADLLFFNPEADNTADVLYAAQFSQGDEEEQVLGRIKIYQPDAAASGDIITPSVNIISQSEGDTVSGETVTLEGEVDNKVVDESYRTGWLVSSGTIENIRKRESEWTEFETGPNTVIMTVRGLNTYNFNYIAIDVTAE